jgi:hypothetical protein
MKKRLFLLSFLAIGFASCNNHRAEIKKKLVEDCEQSAATQVTDNRIVPLIHDYCECSADQLLSKMSEEELTILREKLLRITAPCLKDLQAKSAKLAR